MAVPTSITDCNATAANNSPAGSDSIGTSLDDYLRAHAAIIRQVSDDTLHLAGGTVTGQIKGITPVAAADLTRKDYVDTMLPKSGGSVTGTITTTHQIKGITPVAAEDLARKDYVDSAVSVVNTSSGTYTPSLTNVANASSMSAPSSFYYIRVGAVITVSGIFLVNPNATNTETTIGISLPVASNFAGIYSCSGAGAMYIQTGGGVRTPITIKSNSTSDYAEISFVSPSSAGTQVVSLTFTYNVI